MKSLVLASFLLFSSASFAQYFRVEARADVSAHQVRAVVANNFYEPVECIATAFGRLSNGQIINAQIVDLVPMGQFRFATVFASYPFQFVHGWAEAHCRFLR